MLTDVTDRELAEERARQQSDFLSSVLESLPHPFYVIDANDWTVQIANPAARLGDLSGANTCYSLTHGRSEPCDTASQPCPLELIKRTKKPVTVEHIHLDAAGQERFIEVHGYPLLDHEGNVARIIEYALDVTERRREHAALRESEAKLRMLFETLPIGISILDGDRRVTSQNPELGRILGLSREELREGRHQSRTYLRSDGTVMRPEEFPSARAFSEQVMARDQVGVIKEDGTVIWVDVSAVPVDLGDWKMVLTNVDITARMQAEEALRKSEALLNQTQMTAGIGGWELNVATRQLLWTEQMYRIHQVPPDFQPSLEAGLDFYVPADRGTLSNAVQRALQTGAPWDLELRLVTATGNELWVRTTGRADHRDGRVVRLWGTLQDITERKLAEEALREAAAAAERSRLARDLHDSVTQALFSASLVAEVLPQVWQRDPGEVMQALEELRELTHGALAEMRAMLLELRPAALLESALDQLLRQLVEAITGRTELSVSLVLDPTPALPPEVQLTLYRFCQEAVQNAVKYSGANRLDVALRVSPGVLASQAGPWQGRVVLEVSDDGLGFDPLLIRPEQLGLRIMAERAESIGARLTIQSQPGHGTRVSLAWESAGEQPT